MDRMRRGAALAVVCAAALAGCDATSGGSAKPDKTTASAKQGQGQTTKAVTGASAKIPSRCEGIMPALHSTFQYEESYERDYNDPTTHQLPHDMGTYMKQDIGTYPGLDCAVSGLLDTSNPLSAAEIQIRPYDDFWVKNLIFADPTPAETCEDLHVAGQLRSEGCWSSDGTYIVALATAKVMVMGTFTLYEANDRMGDLRDAVSRDLTRIAANA